MDRYVMISADCHAGAPGEGYRPYVDPEYREQFDEYMAGMKHNWHDRYEEQIGGPLFDEEYLKEWDEQEAVKSGGESGAWEPARRIQELEGDGVVAEVMFSDRQHRNAPPFGAVEGTFEPELMKVGARAFNRWLADFCSAHPDRMAGVGLIMVHDVEEAVKEIGWCKNAGLKGVLLPAGVNDLPLYNHVRYDPIWAAAAEVDLPVHFHSENGTPHYGKQPGSELIYVYELRWFAHRPLWTMIWGGAFERHPALRVVFTEQGADWVPETLEALDQSYERRMLRQQQGRLPLRPSEYWERQCYIGGSNMTPAELEVRHEVGIQKIMWGSDYPHMEGTWPHTQEKLRGLFTGVPESDLRAMLGENAARIYGFDLTKLAPIAERVGPRVEEFAAA